MSSGTRRSSLLRPSYPFTVFKEGDSAWTALLSTPPATCVHFESLNGWDVTASVVEPSEAVFDLLRKPKTQDLTQSHSQETRMYRRYVMDAAEEADFILVAHAEVKPGFRAVVGFLLVNAQGELGQAYPTVSLVAAATHPHVRSTMHGGGIGRGMLGAIEDFVTEQMVHAQALCIWAFSELEPWYSSQGYCIPLPSEPEQRAQMRRRIEAWKDNNATVPMYLQLDGKAAADEDLLYRDVFNSLLEEEEEEEDKEEDGV